MLEDLKRALARVQSDYGFYIECQTNPSAALEGYSLSPDERLALTNPGKLADLLAPGNGISQLRITISGTHDWVNRVAKMDAATDKDHHESKVGLEVDAIKRASTDRDRFRAAFRLMELIG
jgi:hypothetical protein